MFNREPLLNAASWRWTSDTEKARVTQKGQETVTALRATRCENDADTLVGVLGELGGVIDLNGSPTQATGHDR
jgi:hypothetical protein